MTDLTLAVGDRVVYPNQGLCTVTDIKTEEIAGQRLTFVSLVFTETGAKVKVPKEKLAKNGVRRVSTPDDVKAVFDFLKADGDRASLDWKKRARDNTARMSEGGLVGLAEVVKGLQELSELRPLPPKERGQYNDARHLFVEELAAALGIAEADAEDSLDICLFPVGKDRPKRSVEEFQGLGEDDELGLADDLLGIDGGEAESSESEGEAEGEAAAEGDEEGEDGGKKAKPGKKPEKPAAKPKAEAKAPKGKKTVMSDFEPTEPLAAALELPAPKKRGRPPKPKPPEPVEPPAPKKRGRPPKAKPPEAAHPPAKAKPKGKGK